MLSCHIFNDSGILLCIEGYASGVCLTASEGYTSAMAERDIAVLLSSFNKTHEDP